MKYCGAWYRAQRAILNIFLALFLIRFQHLKNVVSHQECGDIFASPKRQLIYEGPLTLYGTFNFCNATLVKFSPRRSN